MSVCSCPPRHACPKHASMQALSANARGSRGGAPIWVMHGEGYGLVWGETSDADEHRRRSRSASAAFTPPSHRTSNAEGDPDGFAVFGRYPKGWLAHVVRLRLLGDVARGDILHVCSGTLSDSERWTVDVRADARPRVQANGAALPFRDAAFPAVMIDPPYSDEYARNLYGIENPRPSWLLREAARVVRPGGRVGILHVAIPFLPPDCRLVRVWPVSTGVGFRIRAFTIYERHQGSLFTEAPAP